MKTAFDLSTGRMAEVQIQSHCKLAGKAWIGRLMSFQKYIVSKDQIVIPQGPLLDANFSQALGSEKVAVHWVSLPAGQRSSTPHAESLEEEFVYVVSGRPHVWINGYIYQLEPRMMVGFPAGTGIVHTFINNTDNPVEMLTLGERTKKENKYIYPMNPELFEEHKTSWWNEWPKQQMGPHLAQPGDLSHQKDWRELSFLKSIDQLDRETGFSYPGDNETFGLGLRITGHVGLKALGLWHEILKSGKRSSWPHAHSLEEEFAVILKGRARVWLNGFTHELIPGDCVYFKPGSNIAHTLVNESGEDLEYLGIGQTGSVVDEDQIFYPFHKSRNFDGQGRWLWENPPHQNLGPDLGLPAVTDVKIQKLADAGSFLKLLKPLLVQKEAEYSLLLGLAQIGSQTANESDKASYLAIYDGQHLVGGCRISEQNIVTSQIPGPLLAPLADYLKQQPIKFLGIVGPPATCDIFAPVWQSKQGVSSKLAMNQKIYQLDKVILNDAAPGTLIKADLSHLQVVAGWLHEFTVESLPLQSTNLGMASEAATRKIKNGEVFLWQNHGGQLVSMNSIGRPTDHGISISWVFTPKTFRGHGYASALVAKTCELMLKQGRKFCVLYTDMANPTSNKIYQKIGFKEVASSKHLLFGD